jgi:hypothetical protein
MPLNIAPILSSIHARMPSCLRLIMAPVCACEKRLGPVNGAFSPAMNGAFSPGVNGGPLRLWTAPTCAWPSAPRRPASRLVLDLLAPRASGERTGSL